MTVTPRPGPASSFTSATLHTNALVFFVTTASRSFSVQAATPMISSPSAHLANRRPERVDTSLCAATLKRRP
jgi:hypothetical protein